MVPIYGTTLVDHRVFVLGGDQKVLDGTATFEVGLNAISTTDLFDTFTKTLCVGYDNVALGFDFIGCSLGTRGTLVVNPSITSLVGLLSLFSTLSKAHLGYLHQVRAFLMRSIYFWSITGLLHTILALWDRVLIILNLAER